MASDNDLTPMRNDWGPRGTDRARERRPLRLGLFPIVLAAAIIFALAFASAPWFAFRAVRSAAQNQDIQALGMLVDYDAVRGAMRAQIEPTPATQVPAPTIWQDPLGAMRRAMEQPIRPQPRVDEYLTPAAFSRMAGGLPPRGPASPEDSPDPFPKIIYWDTGRARIAVEDPGDRSRRTVFTFQRTALFQWKLVQIRLPAAPVA